MAGSSSAGFSGDRSRTTMESMRKMRSPGSTTCTRQTLAGLPVGLGGVPGVGENGTPGPGGPGEILPRLAAAGQPEEGAGVLRPGAERPAVDRLGGGPVVLGVRGLELRERAERAH